MGVQTVPVVHKRDECIGCNSCVLLDPNHRTMDPEDGKATLCGAVKKGSSGVMVGAVDADEIEATSDAASACPVQIIQVMR